jgi:hypothetical protein
MDWKNFPLDMQEHILRSLPLVELARLATTCRSFHAAARKHVPEQMEARCELAVQWFGRKRITCLAKLLNGFFETGCCLPAQKGNYRISPDGVLHVKDPASSQTSGKPPYDVGEILVRFQTPSRASSYAYMRVRVYAPNESIIYLQIWRLHKNLTIIVEPSSEKDLCGVALVQALLTWGFVPKQEGTWLHPTILMCWCLFNEGKGNPSWEDPRVQFQLGPLLPLIQKSQLRLYASTQPRLGTRGV